jgi:hypothetical protein
MDIEDTYFQEKRVRVVEFDVFPVRDRHRDLYPVLRIGEHSRAQEILRVELPAAAQYEYRKVIGSSTWRLTSEAGIGTERKRKRKREEVLDDARDLLLADHSDPPVREAVLAERLRCERRRVHEPELRCGFLGAV